MPGVPFWLRRMLAVLLLVIPVSIILAGSATHDARVLWVNATRSVFKVSPVDGTPELELADLPLVQALAIDQTNDDVWVYSHWHLWAFDSQGKRLVNEWLLRKIRGDQPDGMVVDGQAGNLWIGMQTRLYRLDLTGKVEATIDLHRPIEGLTLDPTRSHLWIAERRGIVVLDKTGTALFTVPTDRPAQALAYDANLDQVWVVSGHTVSRYDANGNQVFTIRESGDINDRIAPDGQGGLWAAGDTTLSYIDESGNLAFTLRPFSSEQDRQDLGWPNRRRRIVDLVADPLNHTAWVADARYLEQYATDSTLKQTIDVATFTGNNPGCPVKPWLPGRGTGDDSDRCRPGRGGWWPFWFGDRGVHHVALYVDTVPPTVSITSPADGLYTNHPQIPLVLTYSDAGSGVDPSTIKVSNDGVAIPETCTPNSDNGGATCTPNSPMPDGKYDLQVTVSDYAGNVSKPASVYFNVDTVPPTITLTSPADPGDIDQSNVTIAGSISEAGTLTINGTNIPLSATFQFTDAVTLAQGNNSFTLTATDLAGNVTTRVEMLMYNPVPNTPKGKLITIGDPINGKATVIGQAGAVGDGDNVIITNTRTGQSVTATASTNGSFTATLPAQWGDPVTLVAQDPKDPGNQSQPLKSQTGTIPPSPANVAPPLTPVGETPFAQATAFLYTGANPIQVGVSVNTIQSYRAAVIRGEVEGTDAKPLAGVVISILDHPEYGYTVSRADGMFDLAVNGGGYLTVTYTKTGYLAAQRQVDVPWRNYTFADTVAMVQPDPHKNPVVFGTNAPLQVARGSVETDSSGTRQATVIFPAGTAATYVTPDGKPQPFSGGDVRLTEVTAGSNGPAAMIAELPATSAYTYALDMSFDQQLAGTDGYVRFNQPVFLYVNDFLKFPAGTVVPNGFYDTGNGQWVAEPNGIVITILGIDSTGRAIVDVDGTGKAATTAELAHYGFTDAELTELAKLYPVGTSLWRVPVTHFCFRDTNWAGYKPDVGFPDATSVPSVTNPKICPGCLIQAENQAVGEVIPIAGTPFSLDYDSERSANSHSIDIPLTTTPPDDLSGIILKVEVAGQEFEKVFTPSLNLSYHFVWNGLDGYGRPVAGPVMAKISLGYEFPNFYYENTPFFGEYGTGTFVTGEPERYGATVWKTYEMPFGKAPGTLAPGWSLSGLRVYDPTTHTMYLGDGTARNAQSQAYTLSFLYGGEFSSCGPQHPEVLGLAPDGSIYIQPGYPVCGGNNDSGSNIGIGLVKYSPQAHNSASFFLNNTITSNIATGQDGTVYAASAQQVYRLTLNGLYPAETLVAGNGQTGDSGDGGLATAAALDKPVALAVSPDGSLYIGEAGSGTVRRVGTNGVITTVGAKGEFPNLVALAVDQHGNVYVAQSEGVSTHGLGVIQMINTAGLVSQVADAYVGSMYMGGDGNLYVTGSRPYGAYAGPDTFVYRVSLNGTVTTLVDMNQFADQTGISSMSDIAVDASGDIFFVGKSSVELGLGVFAYSPTFPSGGLPQYSIPSSDGSRIYHFDQTGNEISEINAFTGTTLESIAYDNTGDPVSITDSFGNETRILWNGPGSPSAVVAPEGQTTTLTMSGGALTAVRTPGGAKYSMSYDAGGLLTSFTNPDGELDSYTYDSDGRLVQNRNAAGGGWRLARNNYYGTDGYGLDMTSAMGHKTSFVVRADGNLGNVVSSFDSETLPNYSVWQRSVGAYETDTSFPGGGKEQEKTAPDPRFGGAVSDLSKGQLCLPLSTTYVGAVTDGCRIESESKTVQLADPANSFGPITAYSDTLTVNGEKYQTSFDPATLTWINTTPMGKVTTATVNGAGQPVSVQAPGVAPFAYNHDTHGRLSKIVWGSGSNARTTSFSYYGSGPQAGYLQSVTDAAGKTLGYQYDADGRVTGETLPDGQEIGFAYDANGNLTSVTPPQRPAHTFAYTAIGSVATYAPPAIGTASDATTYTYNLDNQLSSVNQPDGSVASLNYNQAGQLASIVSGNESDQYSYGFAQMMPSEIDDSDGEDLAFVWPGSLLTTEYWQGLVQGAVAYTYDQASLPDTSDKSSNFRISSIAVNSSAIDFSYDNDGDLMQAGDLAITRDPASGFITGSTLGDLTTARSYNAFGEIAKESAGDSVPQVSIQGSVNPSQVSSPTLAVTGTLPAGDTLVVSDAPASGSPTSQNYTVGGNGQVSGSFGLQSGVNALTLDLKDNSQNILASTQASVTLTPPVGAAGYADIALEGYAQGNLYFSEPYENGSSSAQPYVQYELPLGQNVPIEPPQLQTGVLVFAQPDQGSVFYTTPSGGDVYLATDGGPLEVVADTGMYTPYSAAATEDGTLYFSSGYFIYKLTSQGSDPVADQVTEIADLGNCKPENPFTSGNVNGLQPLVVAETALITLHSSEYGLTAGCQTAEGEAVYYIYTDGSGTPVLATNPTTYAQYALSNDAQVCFIDQSGSGIDCENYGGSTVNLVPDAKVHDLAFGGNNQLYYVGDDPNAPGFENIYELSGQTAVPLLTQQPRVQGTLSVTSSSSVVGALYSVSYTRDTVGRITQKTETVGGTTNTWIYGYDRDGRLNAATENGNPLASYGYDANGNRVSLNATNIASYDNQDRLVTYGDNSYTYNANGELSSKTGPGGAATYGWDAFGNLTDVTMGGKQVHYIYDGQNRLVGKEVNGTLTEGFLYNGQLQVIAELDANQNVVEQFVYGTRPNVPDYIIKGGVEYRVISDQVGSPVLIVDASTGAIAEQISYNAWGNITSDSNPGFQPFGFAGGLYDRDTGLVHFGARDYDPQTGRWISKDPILFAAGDTDLYSYVINDPINMLDRSGLDGFPMFGGYTPQQVAAASVVQQATIAAHEVEAQHGAKFEQAYQCNFESNQVFPWLQRFDPARSVGELTLATTRETGLWELETYGELQAEQGAAWGSRLSIGASGASYLVGPAEAAAFGLDTGDVILSTYQAANESGFNASMAVDLAHSQP